MERTSFSMTELEGLATIALTLLRGSTACLAPPEELPADQEDATRAVLRW